MPEVSREKHYRQSSNTELTLEAISLRQGGGEAIIDRGHGPDNTTAVQTPGR